MSLLSRLAVQAARAYGILSSKSTNVSADYLVVAGGGGGGGGNGRAGGGGGAGGYLTSTATLSTLNTYSISVGAGGVANTQGANSVLSGTGLSTITSTGGGKGSQQGGGAGGNGGSGGGAGELQTAAGGTATSGQGNNGGAATGGYNSGGGGGAGAVGANASGAGGGAGGNGLASSISGSSVTYSGGGGGGSDSDGPSGNPPGGAGGSGGGGAGANSSGTGTAGTTNTGGGGGGGSGAGGGSQTGGSGGSGIVIISYTSATPKFVGGTITTSGGKQIHTFTSSGTLSPITPITASYLVVAGGGGGGSSAGGSSGWNSGGGGGGAGGLQTGSTTLYSGASYIVTIGAGGSGVANSSNNGSDSSLSGTGLTTVTSTGGGAGGVRGIKNGQNGGSGGGGSAYANTTAGTGTSGQGNNGGNGWTSGFVGGGGGGAGSAGTAASGSNVAGNGGSGSASSISGTSTYYAGGGGAGGESTLGGGGVGGTGGGGNGSLSVGVSGTTNLGGGGGGGGNGVSGLGGNGGSGIVIISYAGSQAFNGGLVTSSGGNTIHTFTSSGALTPLTNNLNNSLRFRSSATANLTRTPATTTNRRTYTWSSWVKRGALPSSRMVLFIGDDGTIYTYCAFSSSNQLEFYHVPNTSGTEYKYVTSAVFRDPSAWYHVVFAIDTTQATAGNRVKIYVNGVQQTISVTTAYGDIPQNTDTYINTNNGHTSFGWNRGSSPFDGYATDVNFIDGQALEPYYFGNNDANGVWKPILYKGTYGTNGFYLTFGNTTSTTTLGYDSSPNGNNWTTNNISLTAGTTYDAMTDVPTNTSATVANYAVLNPANISGMTLSEANLKVSQTATAQGCRSTIAMTSGKWYWEITNTSGNSFDTIGIVPDTTSLTTDLTASGSNAIVYYAYSGNKIINGTSSAYGATYTTNDIIGVAVDIDSNTVTFYKNNTSQGTITGLSLSGFTWYAANGNANNGINTKAYNFGQRPFSYTPPTGFVALNTFNLPTPTILQGNKYMDATTYTGTGVSQTVVNQGQFKSDLIWIKQRNSTEWNILADSIRGTNKQLFSNSSNAEQTNATFLTAFANNGFTVDTSTGTNGSGFTYVGWQWQAGQGSTSTNTSGSITSTVSVNTTAGFSVVTYTGTGSAASVGHGLGVTPEFIIVKRRDTTANWMVVSKYLNNYNWYLKLNLTDAQVGDSTIGNIDPTSSLFHIGTNAIDNASGGTYVAYVWAPISGFSAFGSYTGNGNADGAFVYLGFRPKFVMIKASSSAGYNWYIWDTSRNTYNVLGEELSPNLADAAATQTDLDITSNGFKLRTSASRANGSGITYIYACFASNPFKNSNAF